MDSRQLDRSLPLHQCFKYVEDDATVRTVFTEKQPFKGVENYFTDALLYQEIGETSKESLSNDDDSGNEADSESEADMPAILIGEPIIACLNNPQCNTPEDEGEWLINDNILNPLWIALCTCLYINQVHPVHP